ncbi:MAG TPA: flagellar hook assembly protein FlgD [Burkholderiaceae bacterium]|nr:flagellar hook assembly protein FlgD [Burkholderiaceae bacterium]
MTTVTNTSATSTTLGSTSSTTKNTSPNEVTEDRFLKLLVAQMNNQDPLNPLDNAAVTSQMAQINTVNGIEKLNTTVKSLMTQFTMNQSLQGAALVGRSVLVDGNSIRLSDGMAAGGFKLDSAADKARVEVIDAGGAVLDTLNLGALKAGTHTFAWDGKAADGRAIADGMYSFRVTATQANNPVTTTTLAAARVISVANNDDGLQLDLQDLGSHAYADVKSIF